MSTKRGSLVAKIDNKNVSIPLTVSLSAIASGMGSD